MDGLIAVERALLSVSDKRGLVELARDLASRGVELLASGGTHHALSQAGIPAVEVSAYTGQPQILGGRVKTLHPRIHGGILARRDLAEDRATLDAHSIPPIDLVVVNLYPFEATIAHPDCTFEEAIENIDIGGPTLIRAAAKNHAFVSVLTHPDQYPDLLHELSQNGGTTPDLRRRLASAAFRLTATYDSHIDAYLHAAIEATRPSDSLNPVFTQQLELAFDLRTPLRYGENPHQRAAFYVDPNTKGPNLATARILHGKELSYNNLLDLDSALRLVRLFDTPASVLLKHNNPCGAAIADDLPTAFERAYEGDPVSAFGGIVGLNRPVDLATAERMVQPGRFLECIIAPGFEPAALNCLTTRPTWKNSVRLIDLGHPLTPSLPRTDNPFDLRRIEGGLLVQDWDHLQPDPANSPLMTKRPPTESERRDLDFAWRVCSAVKSNAIVLVRDGQLIGVGAGQMSRLDSVRIAVAKAGDRAQGSVLASDAFFPFRDGPDEAAAAGVVAIIQPGGSKRDRETIDACDEHNIAMLFTGHRHFRH